MPQPSKTIANIALVLMFSISGFLTFESPARSQTPLDQAHAILQDLSLAQSQKRDETNIQKLKGLMTSVPREVPQLVNKGILDLLNSPGHHSADEIRERVVATLQVGPPDQYEPEVFVLAASSKKDTSYIVAYNLVYCVSCSTEWIGVVGMKNGRYEILSSEDNPFLNKSLKLITLEQKGKAIPRFLMYGTNWGDAHNRLSLVAYDFDGQELKRIWTRSDLPQGSVEILSSEIILTFLTKLEPPPTGEMTEIYSVDANGIQLKTSTERPIE